MIHRHDETLWHPVEFITEPNDQALVQVRRDHWWLVNDRGWIAIHGLSAPLCNSDRRISELLVKKGTVPGATGVRQIPLAFTPIRIDDW